jgi:phosphoribosylformylglycinamidine synthase
MTTYTGTVRVTLKSGVLDPEAETTRRALERLGFEIDSLRVADVFEVDLEAESAESAERAVEQMAERLLANPTIHDYTIEVTPAT